MMFRYLGRAAADGQRSAEQITTGPDIVVAWS